MSDACTATIEYVSDDFADRYNEKRTRSRLARKCCECGETIPAGEEHWLVSMKYERRGWDLFRTCVPCWWIAGEFSEGGRVVGTFWESMGDGVWNEGGHILACMERVVGVREKQKLRVMWLLWKRLAVIRG